ncbi:hypothetical protein BCR42DRAFT_399655 [Absidia repens]|uniref:BCD1 alpha/beta domain-containing protein n=1 Tax=Absidia repens TaxID=90262 RepID=A0A1X2J079_9FUNG|nr:hypothetical protein BCR42DRAFT_399655 [Absidia repens]
MCIDYVYLEDVSRQSDTVTRHRLKDNKPSNPVEYKSRMVVKQARAMGILYDMLPVGMSRRKANKTNYSTKMKQLFWTLEFCFCLDNMQERVLEHSCPSNKTLHGVFENLLFSEKPQGQNSYATIRHQVRHFLDTDMNDWVIGMKKEGAKRNTYINLTSLLHQPIKDCLSGERVIEYPTIFIWLKDHLDPSIQLEDKYTVTATAAKDKDDEMINANDKAAQDNDNASSSGDSSSSGSDSSDDDDDDDDDDLDGNDDAKGNDLDSSENSKELNGQVEGDSSGAGNKDQTPLPLEEETNLVNSNEALPTSQ